MAYNKMDDIGIPDYQILIFSWDRSTNKRNFVVDLSNILTSNLQINKERNKPDACTFTVEYLQFKKRMQDEGSYSAEILQPWLTEIKVTRNFQTVFDGFLYSMEMTLGDVGEQRLKIEAFDWSKMFEKRYVSCGFGDMSYPEIAQKLIYEAQHELNWIENYAFEASDDEAYLSGWTYNNNLEPPKPNVRVPSNERLWGGGLRLEGNIFGPVQGARDYNGEEMYFSCYYKGSSTVTLTFYSGTYDAPTLVGSTSFSLPSTSTWTFSGEQNFTFPAGKVSYIRITANVDISEIQLYRKPYPFDEYDLGITVGIFDPTWTTINREFKTWNYRKDRIRHYHKQEVLTGLYNLSKLQADSNDGDQFEFLIDDKKKLNIWKYHGHPIADPAAALNYPGEIKTLSIIRDIESVNNVIIGSAEEDVSYKDGEGNEKNYTRVWESMDKSVSSLQKIGALQEVKTYDGVNSQNSIDEKVAADLNSYGDIQSMPTLTVDSNIYNPSNLDIGDAIAIRILDDEMFKYIQDVYRVYSYTLSVSTDTVENMSFELITPSAFTIQIMSFVQRFKIAETTIKRLQAK